METFKNLRVLITVSDSKTNIERKDIASMVITVVNDGRPGLAYKVITSHCIEVDRVNESLTNEILFSSSMGVSLPNGIGMVALEMIEHNHSPFIKTTAHTNIGSMSGSYIQLINDECIYVAYGEVKEFELGGELLQRLLHRLDESIWV